MRQSPLSAFRPVLGQHRRTSVHRFLLATVTLLILSALFIILPPAISPLIIWPCLFIFYLYFATTVFAPIRIHPAHPTSFRLDTIFLTFYFILFYLPYQAYVLGLYDITTSAFLPDTYQNQANQAILASTIGLIAFMEGIYRTRIRKSPPQKIVGQDSPSYIKGAEILGISLTIISIIAFSLTGLRTFFEGAYSGSSAQSVAIDGLYFLANHFICFSLAITIYRYSRTHRLPWWSLVNLTIAASWAILLLVLGDRNTFLLIAIVGFGGYYTFIKPISRRTLALYFFSALLVYQIVEISRTSQERSLTSLFSAIIDAPANLRAPEENSFSITSATARAAFKLVPDHMDYFYGKLKFIGLAGVVPFSRSLFVDSSDPFVTSADVLGYGILGPTRTWSVGSNIIADIYLDFGLPGIIVLMFILGRIAGYIQRAAQRAPGSTKWAVVYIIALALYSELPRYSFDFHIRSIAWALITFIGYDLVARKKKKLSK